MRTLITEVSSRINFSPRFNEINLKSFAAVIIFDLFYHSKKFPHSSNINHLGMTTSLFSSQKKNPNHPRVIILYVTCVPTPFTNNHQTGTTCNSITCIASEFLPCEKASPHPLLFEKSQKTSLWPYFIAFLNLFSGCIKEHRINT